MLTELNFIFTICGLYSGVVFFSLWITYLDKARVKSK